LGLRLIDESFTHLQSHMKCNYLVVTRSTPPRWRVAVSSAGAIDENS